MVQRVQMRGALKLGVKGAYHSQDCEAIIPQEQRQYDHHHDVNTA